MSENVLRYPSPSGLVRLRDLPERPELIPWYSGFPSWRKKLQIAPGTLVVVSGHPGHGKSSLIGNLVFNTLQNHNLQAVVASFENHPIPSYRRLLRQFHAGCAQDRMTDQQMREADDFIEDHYQFVIHPQERPTLQWLLDTALEKLSEPDILIIDPWNRLESQREAKETETEYIAWALIEMRLFAVQQNCCVIVVAHPAKRDPRFRSGVPYLEDISGSKNWDNMPDQGIVIHRDQPWDKNTRARLFDATVYHLKSRFEELGYPCQLDVRLNCKTWRFEEVGG
jgi:twinkle protein